MRRPIAILFPLLLSGAGAQADQFAQIRCGADIPKALVGQRESNAPVVKTEAAYKHLRLEHLGADIVADDMNAISWRLCGQEYLMLDKGSIIRDVIAFPPHSKTTPAFSGSCRIRGRDTKDMIVGVLDASGKGERLPAKEAWRIDEKAAKFVRMDVRDMLCPRSGVYTADGGM
ncbi:hypothetical protein [Methylocystis parvus]|uniref:Uncharacterized protein n=1 Tax=Methylocystis parvus TaxID=134 RepID=A0A6B8M6R7_9HYPH|nr:hypothetical protein [Methylocystis parvus]QGM98146.1 hypothetical protein F7D14_12105 [Methylocystis parvus]WBK01532.1 hypothetical protein MMG94_07470 [Methylocystis parvus OBBP]